MEPFYTKDGREVNSLSDMADALATMSDEDFAHHVSPQHNDVAIWVEDVHKNEELARALSQTADKEIMIDLLRGVSNSADFPSQEDYHPSTAMGKEDAEMHDSYNNKEEWQAAKEAAHPDEDIQNPLTGEGSNSNLSHIADEYNEKNNASGTDSNQSNLEVPEPDEVEEPAPITEPEKALVSESENKPLQHPVETNTVGSNTVETAVHNPVHGIKDKIIFMLIGLIIGLIIGYGVSLVMS